jgi:hypothetical protein
VIEVEAVSCPDLEHTTAQSCDQPLSVLGRALLIGLRGHAVEEPGE